MQATPDLEAGLVFVEAADRGAFQRLVLDADVDRETLWIDSAGVANTYSMLDESTRRDWQGIRIARAFQAHQHYQLVQDTIDEASSRTDLLVAPNVAVHYERADHSAEEIDRLFTGTIALLSSLARSLDVPALVNAPYASDERRNAIGIIVGPAELRLDRLHDPGIVLDVGRIPLNFDYASNRVISVRDLFPSSSSVILFLTTIFS